MFYPVTLKLISPAMSHEKRLIKMLADLEADHQKHESDMQQFVKEARHYCTQKNVLYYRLRSKVTELSQAVKVLKDEDPEDEIYNFHDEFGFVTEKDNLTPAGKSPEDLKIDKVRKLKNHLAGISKDLESTVASYAYYVQRSNVTLKKLDENEFHINEIINVAEAIPAEELFLNTMDLED